MEPHTGRTHQLRLHMKNRGHLIVGDKMYADGQKTILGKGLMLCARKLEFKHPISGEQLSIEIEIPTKFTRILKREKERFSA
jgi:23S rRNA-/tRNA-specific pseudouridylate synthase